MQATKKLILVDPQFLEHLKVDREYKQIQKTADSIARTGLSLDIAKTLQVLERLVLALLEVLDGVFTAADDKQVTVLIGLDLSAAFDTVDHRLLLDRLRLKFGVMEIPLRWLQSYLEGRTKFIKMGQHESHATEVDVGVPQVSVLGPLLFAAQ